MPVIWFVVLIFILMLFSKARRNYYKLSEPYNKTLVLFTAEIAGWVMIELLIQLIFNETVIIFLHEVKYVFVILIPSTLLMFVNGFIGQLEHSNKVKIFTRSVGIIFLIVIATNNFHHLFRKSIALKIIHTNIVVVKNGIAFYSLAAYLYVILIYTAYKLYRYKQSLPKIYRRKSLLLLIGIYISFGMNILYHFLNAVFELNFDATPISFGVLALIFYYSIYKYKYTEISKLAKDMTLNDVGLGLLFLDYNNNIYYMNELAQIITKLKIEEVIYKSIFEIESDFTKVYKQHRDKRQDIKYRLTSDQIYYYNVSFKEIIDENNQFIGTLIKLVNITAGEMKILRHLIEGIGSNKN